MLYYVRNEAFEFLISQIFVKLVRITCRVKHQSVYKRIEKISFRRIELVLLKYDQVLKYGIQTTLNETVVFISHVRFICTNPIRTALRVDRTSEYPRVLENSRGKHTNWLSVD